MSTLGSHLKRLRKAANMSLQDVATAAALSKAHVWELETGAVNPTIKSLCSVAIALDADAEELAASAVKDCMETLNVRPVVRKFVIKGDR